MLLAKGCAVHLNGALRVRPQARAYAMAASSTAYTTLERGPEPHQSLFEVKHSKFLTRCWQALNAEEVSCDQGSFSGKPLPHAGRPAGQAQAFIEAASDPGASHNCWAYRVGGDAKCSDDGEG